MFADLLDRFTDAELSRYLTTEEAREIHEQFERTLTQPDMQVMWTGVPREWVQYWADRHHMWTLTSAMGPLMNPKSASCSKKHKSLDEWSRYVRGASAIFALHVKSGETVTVLARPPPTRTNPTGRSTYQEIEELILKSPQGTGRALRIDMVHFTVVGAERARYQVWPNDEVGSWSQSYGVARALGCTSLWQNVSSRLSCYFVFLIPVSSTLQHSSAMAMTQTRSPQGLNVKLVSAIRGAFDEWLICHGRRPKKREPSPRGERTWKRPR